MQLLKVMVLNSSYSKSLGYSFRFSKQATEDLEGWLLLPQASQS